MSRCLGSRAGVGAALRCRMDSRAANCAGRVSDGEASTAAQCSGAESTHGAGSIGTSNAFAAVRRER